MFERLKKAANTDTALIRRGRHVSLTFLLGDGGEDYLVRLDAGRITDIRRKSIPIESGVFAIRAHADVWQEHWQTLPRRDHHDLFSMMAAGLATIDGDITPFMQNLLYFKALISAPRSQKWEAA